MHKLFDEINEYKNNTYQHTLWYGYINVPWNNSLIKKIVSIVQRDFSKPLQKSVNETHWVFYNGTVRDDALSENIRSSIMIREKDGVFMCHCNFSDSEFTELLDSILNFQNNLQQLLNSSDEIMRDI